jgi:hypothetical protein
MEDRERNLPRARRKRGGFSLNVFVWWAAWNSKQIKETDEQGEGGLIDSESWRFALSTYLHLG